MSRACEFDLPIESTREILRAAVVGWGEQEGQLSEREVKQAMDYINKMEEAE